MGSGLGSHSCCEVCKPWCDRLIGGPAELMGSEQDRSLQFFVYKGTFSDELLLDLSVSGKGRPLTTALVQQ